MNAKELIAEVAKRHGVLLTEQDPVLLTVWLNEAILAEQAKEFASIVAEGQRTAATATVEELGAARKAAAAAVAAAGERAAEDVRAAGAAVGEDLRKLVAKTAAEAALRRERVWRWALASVTATLLVMGATGAVAYAAGRARGLDLARDEQAAASWANTPEGRLAHRLAQGGDLEALARCTAPGWHLEEEVCFPRASANGLHGWRTTGTRR